MESSKGQNQVLFLIVHIPIKVNRKNILIYILSIIQIYSLQTIPAKKSAALDVEPVYTFRAHTGMIQLNIFKNSFLFKSNLYHKIRNTINFITSSIKDQFYHSPLRQMAIIAFREVLTLQSGVGICLTQLQIHMIRMVRISITFSYKLSGMILNNQNPADKIPYYLYLRPKRLGSNTHGTHRCSLEFVVFGRKSPAIAICLG